MSAWNDFEKELRLEETALPDNAMLQQEEEFERALEKAIDRRIRRICLKTIGVVTVLAVAVFLGISPLMDALCPNPMRLDHSGVSLTAYLRAYYETVQPFTEVIDGVGTVEKRGFGRYTVRFQSVDHVAPPAIGRCNAAAEFQYGQFQITESDESAQSSLTVSLLNRFGGSERDEVLAQLRELPASSRVYLSVTAPEPVEVESLRQQDGIVMEWVQIESGSRWQGGLSLGFCTCDPEGVWRSEMDDAALRQQYLANLDLLLSEPQLLRRLSFWTEQEDGAGGTIYQHEVVREARDEAAAQTGPLMTRRYSFCGKRDAVEAYLSATDLAGVHVEKATLT